MTQVWCLGKDAASEAIDTNKGGVEHGIGGRGCNHERTEPAVKARRPPSQKGYIQADDPSQ